ncbi:MAG TPA: hypothetical protein VJY34_06275 [Roseiarcus sp.]|nr:hypothetical protein [Roseiarcus sp.]
MFLAIEHGSAFAADAAAGSIAGVVAQAAFFAGYTALASRGLLAAIAAGTLAYVAAAAAVIASGLRLAALFLLAVVSLTLVLCLVPRRQATTAKPRGAWDMLARMGVTTALVVGLLRPRRRSDQRSAARRLVLIGASIAAFAKLAQGPSAGVAVLRGMAAALYAFAVFFLVAGTALQHMPLAAAFGLATAGALPTQGATLRFVRPRKKDDAAGGEAAAPVSRS